MSRTGGRFAREAVVYGTGALLQRGLPILALPILTRIIGVDEIGVVGAALALANVLSIIFSLGVNFAIVRLYYDEPENARSTHWAMLLQVQLFAATLLACLTFATGPFWAPMLFGDIGWAPSIMISILYALALAIQTVTQGVLRAARRPFPFLSISALQSVIGACAGLFLASVYGAAGYLAGIGIGSAAGAVVGLVLTARKPLWNRKILIAGLALSLPFLVHWLATWALNLSDRILIERILGTEAVGRYYIAYAIGTASFLLFEAVQSAWVPHYYSLPDNTKALMPKLLALPATLIASGLALLVSLLAPYLALILAPSSYSASTSVMAVVAAATVVRPVYFIGIAVTGDAKDSKSAAAASAVAATACVGGNLALLGTFGLIAAAASTLIAFSIQSCIMHVRAGKYRQATPLSKILAAWCVGVAIVAGAGLLPVQGSGLVLRSILTLIVGILLAWYIGRMRHVLKPSPATVGKAMV